MPSNVSRGARTAFEQFILDRQKELSKKLGKKDYAITPEEYNKAVVEFFGEIPLPQGASEVSRSATELVYKGADGKQYKVFRNTDSDLGLDTGRLETETYYQPGSSAAAEAGNGGGLINKQSAAGEQDYAGELLKQLQGYLNTQIERAAQPPGQNAQEITGTDKWLEALFANAQKLQATPELATLDPNAKAALDAITAANQATLAQQFDDQAGSLTAALYGRGVNRSSIAGSEAGRLLQSQGLVQQQELSAAAQRELAIRQLLTQLGSQNLTNAGAQFEGGGRVAVDAFTQAANQQQQGIGQGFDLLQTLLGQSLARETAGVQLGQEAQRIKNQQTQFEKNYGLADLQNELADQERRRQANAAMWNSILGGAASLGTSLLSGGLGDSLSSLFGGGAAGGVGSLVSNATTKASGAVNAAKGLL